MNSQNPMIGESAKQTLDRLVYCSYSLAQQLDGFQDVIIEELDDIEQHDLIMKVNAAAIFADSCQDAITHGYWQHSNELSATRQQLEEANQQLAEANKQVKVSFDEGVKQGKKKKRKSKKNAKHKALLDNTKQAKSARE